MLSVKKRQYMLLFSLPVTLMPIWVAGKTGQAWMNSVALILLAFWFIMVAVLWRCPYCNKRLPGLPSRDVEVCKHCGRDLTEEN
jgi:hypothetical protein